MSREVFIEALCAPELADIVDLVCWVEDGPDGRVPYAANSVGRVRWHVDGPAEVVAGDNPIGSEDPLAFLEPDRRYRATIYRDGDDADWKSNPYDCLIEERTLTGEDSLELRLAAGGGAAVRLQPDK